MQLKTIVERVDRRLTALGRTHTDVSRAATGSTDTIRNWRRRAETAPDAGVSVKTLDPVAHELGVTAAWLGGEGPIDMYDQDKIKSRRERLLEAYDGLEDDLQEVALNRVRSLAPPKPGKPVPGGQGEGG